MLGLVALAVSCVPLSSRPPEPGTPFEPISREFGPKLTQGSGPAAPQFRSRYAAPGDEGVILEPPRKPGGSSPTGTSAGGLAVGCDPPHYLLDRSGADDKIGTDNRFSWWTKTPPPSGPLRPPAVSSLVVARDSVICHFHPALARIVGASSSRIIDAGFKLLSWEDASIPSPNLLPGVEFIVRRLRPHSVPAVRDLARGGGGGTERVLVNEASPGVAPDVGGDRFRPSLWLDFAVPQRAVAVEFGVPTDANQDINQAGAKLIGYDRNGRVLRVPTGEGDADLRSDGRAYGTETDIPHGDYGNVVGIQDREGRIASVELRFDFTRADALDRGGNPGSKIAAPQVVRRIWHEPLPPAAVLQGFVGVSTFVPPVNPPPNVLVPPTFEQRFGKAPGPETVTLPFGLDRAIVMMRGMRWQFSNPSPRRITELSAEIRPFAVAEFAPDAARLTITPGGRIVAEAGSTHAFHLIVDYTVLAWRSTQVELFGLLGTAASGRAQENRAVTRITVGDPCPFSSTTLTVARRREVCGPLLGVPHGFAILMNPAQEIDRLDFIIASETGLASRQGASLRRDDQGGQPVVVWEQGTVLDSSDDNANRLEFFGTVVTGTSLRVGPDDLGSPPPHAVRNAANPSAFPSALTGPRDDRRFYGFPPEVHREFGIAWPVRADVGFVAFDMLFTQPGGGLEQLDFEVKGERYDGLIIDWKTGLGINTEPPVIGGAGATRDRNLAATALFGAVDNVQPFSLALAAKHDLVFENGVTGLTQRAVDIPGFIENTSRDALWIDDIRRGTQAADSLFQLEFLLARHPMERGGGAGLNFVRVTEDQLRDRLPLLLRPGERISILGRYTPTAATTFLPDLGSVEFRLRGGLTTSLRVFAAGSAIEGNPGGQWRPSELVFMAPAAGAPPQALPAQLVATGTTPLAVRRLSFEDATLGYRFEPLPQIEPELMGVRVICGDPSTACRGQTRLIADTNAGPITLTVRVQQ